MSPMDYVKKEAIRVRQMYRFKRPDGTEYENHVRLHRLDETVEDLSDKNIKCEDLGMRKGQIWRQSVDKKYSPKLRKHFGEWLYHMVTDYDEDGWVHCKLYDIEKRELAPAYQSQAMERQARYINDGYELYEGKLFEESK